jgi:hypothetical protein
MKRTILLGALAAALIVPFAAARAHSNVSVSVSTPEFGIRIGAPVYRPVPVVVPAPVYAPAPVYVPPPVYVAPRPVYVAPRPVYVAPRVVYPAPVVVVPPRVVGHYGPGVRVAPRHGHRHWDARQERRERRDRHEYRAGYGF